MVRALELGAGGGRGHRGGRLWVFADTPRLSTYVVVANAGRFHEICEPRGDRSLRLWLRQSLLPHPEREPDPEVRLGAYGPATEESKPRPGSSSGAGAPYPPVRQFGRRSWRPIQYDLVAPWAHRYLDEVNARTGEGLLAVGSKVRLMMPATCDEAWLERARELAGVDDAPPTVRTELLVGADRLGRVRAARA